MMVLTRRGLLESAAAAAAVAAVPEVVLAQAVTAGAVWGVEANDNLAITKGGSPNEYWPYMAALETKMGRKFAGWRRNGITGADDFVAYRKCYDRGWHWSYANGKQDNLSASGKLWADTAAGKYDSFYTNYFNQIKADARWTTAHPFHYSYHHEQYVTSEGGGSLAGTATQYKAAFAHVRHLMDLAGAHIAQGGNMMLVFVPHVNQFYMDPTYGYVSATSSVAPYVVSKIDPGPALYDKVGADIYLRHTASISATRQWTPVHKFALDRGKSFFTGETGVAGTDSKVISYLKELNTLLKGWGAGAGPGQIEAILWTSRYTPAQSDDDRLDATAARLKQYKAMALDPFYGGTA